MAQIVVTFVFHSGVKRHLFQNVWLSGSWDANGVFSNQWTQTPMVESQDETGCDALTASVSLKCRKQRSCQRFAMAKTAAQADLSI